MPSSDIEIEHPHDGVVVVRPLEDVDLATTDAIQAAALRAVTNEDRALVVDLSEAEFLDSAGVRMLYELSERLKARRQQLRLVIPAGSHLLRIISLVGLDAEVAIDDSLAASTDRLTAGG